MLSLSSSHKQDTQLSVYIDKQSRINKPVGREIGYISSHITNRPAIITTSELAHAVGEEGYTIVPCLLSKPVRKQQYFLKSNLVLVDIDNGTKVDGIKVKYNSDKYISLHTVLNDKFTKQNAAFVYETFSSTKEWNRFRIVFILNKFITNINEYSKVSHIISSHYNNYDSSVCDPTRLFFGGNKLYTINLSNKVRVGVQLVSQSSSSNTTIDVCHQVLNDNSDKYSHIKGSQVTSVTQNSLIDNEENTHNHNLNLRVFTNYESKGKDVCRHLFNKQYEKINWENILNKHTYTESEFYEAVTNIDIRKLLCLPNGTFLDILHEEDHPSATVIKQHDGSYHYTCFSRTEYCRLNLISLIARMTDTDTYSAFNLLSNLFNVTITDSFADKVDNIHKLIRKMKGKRFEKQYTNTHYYYCRYTYDLAGIMNEVKKAAGRPVWFNNKLHHYFYMSARSVAEKLYGTRTMKYKSIHRLFILMQLTGFMTSCDDDDIPEWLLNKLSASKKAKKYQYRANVYEIHDVSEDFLDNIEKKCKWLRENGVTMSGLSKELLMNLSNKETADKVFVQDKDRKLSRETTDYTSEAVSLISEEIDRKGYAVEKEVINSLAEEYGKGKSEYKMKQIRPLLINNYCYTRTRLTANLRKKMGLSTGKGSPVVYLR